MQGIRIAFAAVFCASLTLDGVSEPHQDRLDEALRRQGEALVALADAAIGGASVPADFQLHWRNDFFKAQPGTFVPFTVSFDAPREPSRLALLYVRVEALGSAGRARPYAYETIFPVKLERTAGRSVSVTRGFAIAPGRYRVVLVLRESTADPAETRRAGVLLQDLDVPDLWTGELATSTVMLAERIEHLKAPVPPDQLDEDPYAVGSNRIHVTGNRVLDRGGELIVAFLIYNLSVGPDAQFDAQVDYHLYKKVEGGHGPPARVEGSPPARAGEQYVTRTHPQRFSPSMMGAQFDPRAGTPLLAGQGILLRGFEPGDYRLEITVTDLLSRKSLSRDVAFTVSGS